MASQGLVNMMLASHNDIHTKKLPHVKHHSDSRNNPGTANNRQTEMTVKVGDSDGGDICVDSDISRLQNHITNLDTMEEGQVIPVLRLDDKTVPAQASRQPTLMTATFASSHLTHGLNEEELFKDCVDENNEGISGKLNKDPLGSCDASESELLRHLFANESSSLEAASKRSYVFMDNKGNYDPQVSDLNLQHQSADLDVIEEPNTKLPLVGKAGEITGGGIQLWNGKFWKRQGSGHLHFSTASKLQKTFKNMSSNVQQSTVEEVDGEEKTASSRDSEDMENKNEENEIDNDNNIIHGNAPNNQKGNKKIGIKMLGTAKNLFNLKMLQGYQTVKTDNEDENVHGKKLAVHADHDSVQMISECSNPNFRKDHSSRCRDIEPKDPNQEQLDESSLIKEPTDCTNQGPSGIIFNKLNSLTRVFGSTSSSSNPRDSLRQNLLTPRKGTGLLYPWHHIAPHKLRCSRQQHGSGNPAGIDNKKGVESLEDSTTATDTGIDSSQQSTPIRFGRSSSHESGSSQKGFNRLFFYSKIPSDNVTNQVPQKPRSNNKMNKDNYPLKPVNRDSDHPDGSFALSSKSKSCGPDYTTLEIPGMEELFNEPKNYQSYDLIWNSSKSLFTWLSLILYRVCTAILAVPFSLVWALIMSITCVLNVWICTPIISFLGIWMEMLQRVWWACCKTCITPIVEAFMLGKWNAMNNSGAGGNCNCCCNKNPQHAINFGGKNGDIMTNGTGGDQSCVKELETKP